MKKKTGFAALLALGALFSCGTPTAASSSAAKSSASDSSVASSAASEQPASEGLRYLAQDDGSYAVSIGDATMLSKVVIPSSHSGKAVTAIKDLSDSEAKNATLVLPSSIKKIERVGNNFLRIEYAGTFADFGKIEFSSSWWVITQYEAEQAVEGKTTYTYDVLPSGDYTLACTDVTKKITDFPKELHCYLKIFGTQKEVTAFETFVGQGTLALEVVMEIPLLRVDVSGREKEVTVSGENGIVSHAWAGNSISFSFLKAGTASVKLTSGTSSSVLELKATNPADYPMPSALSSKRMRVVEVPEDYVLRLWEWDEGQNGRWYDMTQSGKAFGADFAKDNYIVGLFSKSTAFSDADRDSFGKKALYQTLDFAVPESASEKVTLHFNGISWYSARW